MPNRPIILGSSSRYRRELMTRLRLPFDVVAPDVDESPLPGEAPLAMTLRLALAKAQAVARLHPQAVVIGSDQVCDLDGLALGKPGNHARATAQLQRLRGHSVQFHTAVAVVCTDTGNQAEDLARVQVRFRQLTDDEIETYLRLDEPYDCAGSGRCEALGITLMDAIVSDDPTALVGLPLIRTARLLRGAGIDPLHS